MTKKQLTLNRDISLQTNMLHEDGSPARIVPVEWVRTGITGMHHPLGENKVFVLGEVYDNDIYRQFVRRSDGHWDDCLIQRVPGDTLRIIESRVVSEYKVAQVASQWGIRFVNSDGDEIYDIQLPTEVPPPVVSAPHVAREIKPEFNLSTLKSELIERFPKLEPTISTLLGQLQQMFPVLQCGQNSSFGLVYFMFDRGKTRLYPIGVDTNGDIQIIFQYLRKCPPWDTGLINELANRLDQLLPRYYFCTRINGRPKFPIGALAQADILIKFIDILRWVIEASMAVEVK